MGLKNLVRGAKHAVWKEYARYYDWSPLRGKYVLGRGIRALIGPVVVEQEGCLLEMDPTGLIDRRLILGVPHDPLVLGEIRRALANGGTFLDVGANWGYFSLVAAKMPGTRVFAFEPSPRELGRLWRNLTLNQISNVTVFPVGLSETEGTATLTLAKDSNSGMNSMRGVDGSGADGTVTCSVRPLSAMLPPHDISQIRMVKIDVEGAEMLVLRGMSSSMQHFQNCTFAVEISPAWLRDLGCSVAELYEFFERHGYLPRFGRNDSDQYDEIFSPA